ncbi:beta-1,3-galactosyltransferase GALT1-like [Triticum dicoccoides]|uniref:beta-1,3-galactosyltransferase GALT1-like n=1 Tax=Triticum dicoccoides TaxID=85692 RepID=UPI001890E4DB|nr:beta-1,3-galactosyltransferase GALT1-like [Triticum dicoccoides]
MWTTKQLCIAVLITFFSPLIVRHLILNSPISGTSRYQILHANPLAWLSNRVDADAPTANPANAQVVSLPADDSSSLDPNPRNSSARVVSSPADDSSNLDPRNSSTERLHWLNTWNHMKQLTNVSTGLPHATKAIKDARTAWENLMATVQNATSPGIEKGRLCPYSVHRMDASKSAGGHFTMDIPCGLVVGSSITVIGTPGSLSGNFWIDLVGTALPGEPEEPIVLRYGVRLTGDKLAQGPVIVQNAFTASNGWGFEDRCPSGHSNNATQVDDLERCNSMVGREEKSIKNSTHHAGPKQGGKPSTYFPFKQGYLAITTLRIALEGIHMTVDGKHITSFAYRAGSEPWFGTQVRISGDFKLASAIASGLPTSEDLENSLDLDMLKSSPIPDGKDLDLLIGIFSTANNFKRRMAIRRTWMQYDAVRNGTVAVRFFVGLTNAVSAKYLMKTDDDAFVRVHEIYSSVKQLNVSNGLLYGRINSDSGPHRNSESKWYISPEEWPEERYPPWAHGPGYVVSEDIAKTINIWYKTSRLKMFKLEDVAMGIWVDEMKKGGLPVRYETDTRIHTDGCKEGYIVAHYQQPRNMLCIWETLLRTNQAMCCN